ncbi:Protein of unknown function [Gryllus bimaculatus]|nr:Protein of unknown function [Gryllus bimaculatus]
MWAALDAHLGSRPAPAPSAWTPLLLGLRCDHLRAAGAAAAPALLDALNAQLRAARRPFPSALRRCARQAMGS